MKTSRSFKVVLSWSLALSLSLPSGLSAGEVMDQATAQVQENKEKAIQIGELLAMSDVQKSFERVLGRLEVQQNQRLDETSYTSLSSEIQGIEKELTALSQMSLVGIEEVLARRVSKAVETYKKLANQRLRQTYLAVEKRLDFKKLKALVTDVANDYGQICSKGRTELGVNFFNGQFPNVPNPVMSVMISVGSEGPKVDYSGSYGVDPDKEKNFSEINSGLTTAAGITYSFALAPTAGASALNLALIEGAAVAGPYILAAAALFAIYADITMSNELYKKQKDVYNANVHLFENNANNDDIIESYKKSCSSHVVHLNQLADLVDGISENPELNQSLVKSVNSSIEERKKWQLEKNKLNAAKVAQGIIDNAKDSCQSQLDVSSDQIADICTLPQLDWLELEEGSFELTEDLKIEIEARIEKVMNSYEEKYNFNKISKLSSDMILEAILNISKLNYEELSKIDWKKLEASQTTALNRVIKLISSLRSARSVNHEDILFLERELEITDKYEQLRQGYQNLVGSAISEVFGKLPTGELKIRALAFETEWNSFYNLYAESKEVRYFNSNWKRLSNYISGLEAL
ncbi:MAG: hypothetical protein AB8E15_13750 [Bdellovibrionales bacterium]